MSGGTNKEPMVSPLYTMYSSANSGQLRRYWRYCGVDEDAQQSRAVCQLRLHTISFRPLVLSSPLFPDVALGFRLFRRCLSIYDAREIHRPFETMHG